MKSLTVQEFSNWLDAYGRASRDNDPSASAALFSPDAHYYETPFSQPLTGREAIFEYWSASALAFADKISRYQVLAVIENLGVARWQSDFTITDSGQRMALDCIFVVKFDAAGKCRLFQEWWHMQQLEAASIEGKDSVQDEDPEL